ncbi:signal peptide peptidase SppA [Pseudoroseomonas rhizosphaerae]|uniref:Signal peptide peptidase SppA n=1 Tax=Teichococcus rhizosphaerae TaxID=1335062 RepID=A0A2C6Z962_9PROT|nr:signal peptide peptidase SppA [Pseudoroseomonas rhizosphaerae]PHK95041.1 signal peptide peptidase SppA [Pseudoroseomonas rhizosphaerae]
MSASLEHDLLVDRRRLKRRLALWRVLAVLAVLAALFAAFAPGLGDGVAGLRGHVLRLSIEGTITDDPRVTEAVARAAKDTAVRGMILSIDSPGGTVAGGEGLHAALRRFRESGKPLVAVMRGTAASAGYMIAMPAQRVFARESTLTGSIGVILQSFDVGELMRSLGIRAEQIASGPLKGEPNPFRPLSPEGRAALEAVLRDMHAQFVAMVAAGRGMPAEAVEKLADGRVYTGRQALALRLVDAIGGEPEARAWLEAEAKLPAGLPVRDLDPRNPAERALGFSLRALARGIASEWRAIDGARAVWQLPR